MVFVCLYVCVYVCVGVRCNGKNFLRKIILKLPHISPKPQFFIFASITRNFCVRLKGDGGWKATSKNIFPMLIALFF